MRERIGRGGLDGCRSLSACGKQTGNLPDSVRKQLVERVIAALKRTHAREKLEEVVEAARRDADGGRNDAKTRRGEFGGGASHVEAIRNQDDTVDSGFEKDGCRVNCVFVRVARFRLYPSDLDDEFVLKSAVQLSFADEAKTLQVEVTDAQVDAAVSDIKTRNHFDDAQLEQALAEQGLTREAAARGGPRLPGSRARRGPSGRSCAAAA